VTGDHLICDSGNVRDLRWDRKAGIFEPLPGAENFVDPPGLTAIFEEAFLSRIGLSPRDKVLDLKDRVRVPGLWRARSCGRVDQVGKSGVLVPG
jgi:hypothetical protein